jgi:hypothetical protein
MNKRIQELMPRPDLVQDSAIPLKFYSEIQMEEFAELIVRECANSLRTEMYRLDAIPGREVGAQTLDTAQLLIKKHFGVTE